MSALHFSQHPLCTFEAMENEHLRLARNLQIERKCLDKKCSLEDAAGLQFLVEDRSDVMLCNGCHPLYGICPLSRPSSSPRGMCKRHSIMHSNIIST